MRAPAPRPCLLLFTRDPAREAAVRPLVAGAPAALEVGFRQTCLERVLAAGRAAGLELVVSSPEALPLPPDARRMSQPGPCFASRLATALEQAFAAGYGPVLVVPSDLPGLEARHLRRALARLGSGSERVVLGPSPDGGIYLLGAGRPLGTVLRRVRWCRSDTRRNLEAELVAAGHRVERLAEPLADLDRRRDLERWLARASWSAAWRRLLAPLLRALAALRRPPTEPSPLLIAAAPLTDRPSRAPPISTP